MPDQRTDLEAAIDDLHALPLDEFTTARDELARRLRREGDRDAAARVKGLRKPTVAAWALNQVRRADRGCSDELLQAGAGLRDAQERLLAGEGRESLEAATAEERRLVGELARRAEHELVDAGRPVTDAVREKIRATLAALPSDGEAREAFAAGRLVRDHTASGLGPMFAAGDAAPAGGGKTTGRKRTPSSAEKAPVADGGATAADERRARRLQQRLARARARHDELAAKLSQAERHLRDARRAAAQAASELDRAQTAERRAGERANEAAGTVSDLERELRRLSTGD